MLRLLLCLTVAVLFAGRADAAAEVGRVIESQMDAYQAEGALGYVLANRQPIFENARVFTKDYGSVAIKFMDESDLLISPNSSIIIDKYIYDSADGASGFAMRLTKGAMRMISGRMPKEAQRVNTVIAAIGVRGTRYWLDVGSPDILKIWIDEGAVVARPVQSDQEFVFEAPAYAECTVTTCALSDAPPQPDKFPLDPRGR